MYGKEYTAQQKWGFPKMYIPPISSDRKSDLIPDHHPDFFFELSAHEKLPLLSLESSLIALPEA